MNFAYPILHQHSTTHHHYNNDNQVPSQSYSQHPISAIAPPPELILHRPENSMYSSSYMRSGRTLKLATTATEEEEDETTSSSALHHHHHHPAGIVNEYNPRGTASGDIYSISQHDSTPHHASGGHPSHQYEVRFFSLVVSRGFFKMFYDPQHSSSSSLGLNPSRRWSLPETIDGPFRSSGSTM
jgi:hypothetical protein